VKIYVMRHGPAEETSASGSDAERDLTVSGRERVRSVAEALAVQGELPLAIYSSPLVRCLQTAELLAARAGVQVHVSTRRELAPGGNVLALVQQLRTERKRRVCLVGHEPDVSVLVASLGVTAIDRGFMKAMVVGVSLPDLEADTAVPPSVGKLGARLRFVMDPKTRLIERAAP
jgi:phosphohistidine phosphatase